MKTKLNWMISILVITIILAGLVFALPNKAIKKAPPEFVADLPENKLTKVVFIRYAPGKEPACDNDGVCEKKENWKNCPSDCPKGGNGEEPEPKTACYDFLAGSKPRWNWVEDYYYSTSELGTTSAWATTTWNDATSGTIFGNGISEYNPWGAYDYKNSISYGDYPEEGVIGVTAIWYRGKNIYEYDIMFDTDYFPGTIDLPTVTLHEFGHGAGLGDLYDSVCIDEVMYGIYEGVKTDLRSGDIAGIQKLYK